MPPASLPEVSRTVPGMPPAAPSASGASPTGSTRGCPGTSLPSSTRVSQHARAFVVAARPGTGATRTEVTWSRVGPGTRPGIALRRARVGDGDVGFDRVTLEWLHGHGRDGRAGAASAA